MLRVKLYRVNRVELEVAIPCLEAAVAGGVYHGVIANLDAGYCGLGHSMDGRRGAA